MNEQQLQALKVLRESTMFERESLWEIAFGNKIDITDSVRKDEKPFGDGIVQIVNPCENCEYRQFVKDAPCKFNALLDYKACGEENNWKWRKENGTHKV